MSFTLGLDIGRPSEFTALAVVERLESGDHAVRHLERYVPGVPYQKIGESVQGVIEAGGLGKPTLVMDQTAVGSGVRELFRRVIPSARLKPMTITAGVVDESKHPMDRETVPKKELVTGLQLALQSRRLKIPTGLPCGDALVRELGSYRPKVTLAAAAGDADWRDGPHDDLVLAVALALWQSETFPPGGFEKIGFSGPSEVMRLCDELFPESTVDFRDRPW